MKTKSKYLVISMCAMMALAGCGSNKDTSSVVETTPSINASKDVVGTAPNATETVTETTTEVTEQTEPIQETEAPEKTDDPLVPDVELNISDDIPLATVIINYDYEINLLNCTMTELRDTLSIGKGGVVDRFTHDEDDYYFYGEAFAASPSASKINLELLENGEVVTDYTMDKDEDYTVKGLSMKDRTSSDCEYVQFYGDFSVGDYKEQVEMALGQGYDVTDTGKENTVYTYYKNSQATMIIEYKISHDGSINANRITVVVN